MQSHEWLVSNRVGSFAMGTTDRRPTRKYHGLLIARPPDGTTPWHLLADVDDLLCVGSAEYPLASFHYDSCVHPHGDEQVTAFSDAPPTWTYRCGEVLLRRSVHLATDENSVVVRYEIVEAPHEVELLLTPQVTGRVVHELVTASDEVTFQPGNLSAEVTFPGLPGALTLQAFPSADVEHAAYWNERVHYPEEEARGYPFVEDLFAPIRFRVRCAPGEHVTLRAAWGAPGSGYVTEPPMTTESPVATATESPATIATTDAAATPDSDGAEIVARLSRAAQAYCVERGAAAASVIAGYPWFGEWGRDAFIALPGLTLARGDYPTAAGILDHFRNNRKSGLIPNIVGPGNDSDDHSVDATLFFIRAVRMVESAAGPELARRWWPDVLELLEVLRTGQSPGIVVQASGLLAADRRPRAMTWMDALVDDQAVTPRAPYAVEIQALFHDAIDYALDVAPRLAESATSWPAGYGFATCTEFVSYWQENLELLRESFHDMFDVGTHLADSCDGHYVETAVRPNQLFALIGERPLIDGELARKALQKVRECLLTPFGLRTLDPADPAYQGHCVGTQPERDRTYHQGTVWAWLLGPYVDAVAAVEGVAAAQQEALQIVEGLQTHLDSGCLGHVAEIFDGDAPHTPRGAPAQAWSVSELLRIAVEYAFR